MTDTEEEKNEPSSKCYGLWTTLPKLITKLSVMSKTNTGNNPRISQIIKIDTGINLNIVQHDGHTSQRLWRTCIDAECQSPSFSY